MLSFHGPTDVRFRTILIQRKRTLLWLVHFFNDPIGRIRVNNNLFPNGSEKVGEVLYRRFNSNLSRREVSRSSSLLYYLVHTLNNTREVLVFIKSNKVTSLGELTLTGYRYQLIWFTTLYDPYRSFFFFLI